MAVAVDSESIISAGNIPLYAAEHGLNNQQKPERSRQDAEIWRQGRDALSANADYLGHAQGTDEVGK